MGATPTGLVRTHSRTHSGFASPQPAERRALFMRCTAMRACRFRTSSMIDRVAFDDDAHILSISFRQTGRYVYYDVPGALFEALCAAGSVGTFFNERIKGRFRCRRDPERKRFGPNA